MNLSKDKYFPQLLTFFYGKPAMQSANWIEKKSDSVHLELVGKILIFVKTYLIITQCSRTLNPTHLDFKCGPHWWWIYNHVPRESLNTGLREFGLSPGLRYSGGTQRERWAAVFNQDPTVGWALHRWFSPWTGHPNCRIKPQWQWLCFLVLNFSRLFSLPMQFITFGWGNETWGEVKEPSSREGGLPRADFWTATWELTRLTGKRIIFMSPSCQCGRVGPT